MQDLLSSIECNFGSDMLPASHFVQISVTNWDTSYCVHIPGRNYAKCKCLLQKHKTQHRPLGLWKVTLPSQEVCDSHFAAKYYHKLAANQILTLSKQDTKRTICHENHFS